MCMFSNLRIHIIVHLPAEFRPHRTIRNIVLTSYPFSKMAATASQFYIRFWFSCLRSFGTVETRNIPAYQISATCLNLLRIYYYFRFPKINVRHVGILLSVSIFTIASPSACHSTFARQISPKLDHS